MRIRLSGPWTCLTVVLGSLCVLISPALAQAANGNSQVVETRLSNGLVVLTKEIHSVPVVCTYVWYRVGSRNETPGTTGISHQLEHMMFKGTRKEFPNPGYIDLLVGRHGGENNAETDTDFTSYYLLMPSDQLDLALRIEADRMTDAAMDPKQLAAEKTVVLSELEGDENDNAYFLSENARAAAFQYHPYHYPIIGTKWDVEHFTRAGVYDYYRAHYAPNNATLVVVGDFKTAAVIARIRALWRDVKPGIIPHPALNPEPPQRGERRVTVRRAGAAPYLQVEHHIPPATHADLPALAVLGTALADGRSSRLYRALVETQLATSVSAGPNEGMDPELFDIVATVRTGVDPRRVEEALDAEIERLQTEPLDARSLQKAKNQTRAGILFQQDSVLAQAYRIGFYQTVTNDWKNMDRYLDRINAVTADAVRQAANRYFQPDNRTVATFVPNGEKPAPDADGGGSKSVHYKISALPRRQEQRTPLTVGRTKPTSDRLTSHPYDKFAGEFISSSGANSMAAHQVKLGNGLTVIVRENHASPTVAIGGFVRAGSVNDPPGKSGLAALVAEMLPRGTTTRTSQQIADMEDFVGAQVGAGAGRERIDLSASMLREDFTSILGLFADVLRRPAFENAELEKARGETLSALAEAANDTAAVATKRLYMTLYGPANRYTHSPAGSAEDVQSITGEDLRAFYLHAFRPEKTTLIIVGDVTADQAIAEVRKVFADWAGEGEAFPDYVPPPVGVVEPAPQPVMVTLPDKSQDDIAMGAISLSRKAGDYEAAVVMNLILGGDEFVGRVGKRVRDTDGLAYYAYTGFAAGLEPGPFLFRAGVNPRNVSKAIAEARDEIQRMARNGVTESELAWAKDHLIGSLQISLATNDGIVGQLENDAFFGLGLDYADRYARTVRDITKSQVDGAARKYLHPDGLAVVIAGPPALGSNKH